MSDFGLSSTISTLGNVLTDYYGTKYDKQENELSYERAIENRDYMNNYNSPKAQQSRLKAAGLNPNLMYGQGTVGEQKTAPQYEPTKARTSRKSIDPIDIATIAQAKKTEAEAEGITLENKFKQQTLGNRVHGEQYKNLAFSYQAEKLLTEANFQNENRKELINMALKLKRNEVTISNFNAWLAKNQFSKSDSIIARKVVELAEKTGFDERLQDAWHRKHTEY